MRKILRRKLRHQAEKSNYKTKKAFKSLWNSHIATRIPVLATGTKAITKKKKKQSMLHRTVNKFLRKKR